MKAVILAAGYGARLRPLTDAMPKTMVSVAGERIIDRIVDSLLLASVTEIVVVVGYRARELKEHLAAKYSQSAQISFIENPKYAATNNIFSLSLALESLDDDFLLIECDLFFEKNIIRELVTTSAPNCAIVAEYQTGMDGTVVSVGAGGLVESVHPPYAQGPDFNFSGKYKTLNIYKFSREFLNDKLRKTVQFYTQAHSDNCYYEVVLGAIIYLRSAEIRILDVTGRAWMEIDDMNDLDRAEFLFQPGSRYDMLAQRHGGYWNFEVLDFCYIRNMYFPTPSLLGDLRYNLNKLLWNYGSSQKKLNTLLSHFLLLGEQHCCLLNGASQGIKFLPALLNTRRIATFVPTFDEYAGVFPEVVELDPEACNLEGLAHGAAREFARVIVLVNPNNPTGRTYSRDEVIELVQLAARNGQFVVIDESFIDFAGDSGGSVANWLIEHEASNALVLKSLSKSLGVPGLRLGYCVSANTELIAALNALVPIWNTNSLAQYFLELILKYRNEIAASFKSTMNDRELFFSQLAALEFLRPVPSGGNFILCRLTGTKFTAETLGRHLLARHGMLIKACTRKFKAGSGEFVRFAVRTRDDNTRLIQALCEAHE